jgi:hypothetical protein
MPLMKCPDCDGQVSTAASACPHCGRPNAAEPAPTGRPSAGQSRTCDGASRVSGDTASVSQPPKEAAPSVPTPIKCPKCGKNIAGDARYCRSCWYVPVPESAPTASTPGRQDPASQSRPASSQSVGAYEPSPQLVAARRRHVSPLAAVLVVAVGALIVGAKVWFAAQSPVPSDTVSSAASNEPTGSDIIVACEKAVRSRLKAPRSADFPGVFDSVSEPTKEGDGSYSWRSWVDAQNSFGAKLRTHFQCRYVGGTVTVTMER